MRFPRFDQGHLIQKIVSNRNIDLNIKEEEEGYSPLTMAIGLENEWTAALLIEAGASLVNLTDTHTPLYVISEKGTTTLLDEMIKAQPNILNQPVDGFGSRAIHIAIKFKQHHFVRRLVEYHHADINVLDDEKMSPFLTAIQFADIFTASFLLDRPELDITNSCLQGRYPM